MPDWINGPAVSAPGMDRNGWFQPLMIQTQVGYFGDHVTRMPLVGDTYTARILVNLNYPPRGGVIFSLAVQLPPATSFVAGQAIRCFRRAPGSTTMVDVTTDPGANCPTFPLSPLPDGFFDFRQRDVAQGTLFEVRFNLITNAELDGQPLVCRTDSEYGSTLSRGPIRTFRRPGSTSDRLAARVEPRVLPLGPTPANFTVVLEDTGSFAPVAGLVDGWSFLPDTARSRIPIILATNMPARVIFYMGPVMFGTWVSEEPQGKARALRGYERDRPLGIDVPFRFDYSRPWWHWV